MQKNKVIIGVQKVLRRITQKQLPESSSDFPDYFNWLRYAVTGMLIPGNIKCFEYAIKHLPTEDPILEIGSFCGLSTCHIAYFMKQYGKKNLMFTCDRWLFERGDSEKCLLGSDIHHTKFRSFIKDSFLRNVSFFTQGNPPHTIELFSNELFEQWKVSANVNDVFGRNVRLGGNLSFVYIDGNHSYDFAKNDLLNTLEYLVPGGFVLMDDSLDFNNNGASRVAKEALKMPGLRLLARNPNYFFQKV
jgi:hypothetical protein